MYAVGDEATTKFRAWVNLFLIMWGFLKQLVHMLYFFTVFHQTENGSTSIKNYFMRNENPSFDVYVYMYMSI